MNGWVGVILGVSGINLVLILGVVAKGGRMLGHFEASLTNVASVIDKIQNTLSEHGQLLYRTAATLDSVERRVSHLETRFDAL